MSLPDPIAPEEGPEEGPEQPSVGPAPEVAPAEEGHGRQADEGAAPTGSVATGLSLMIFGAVMSFVMVTTGLAYFLMAVVYFVVDAKKWWRGAPFLYAGKYLYIYMRMNFKKKT